MSFSSLSLSDGLVRAIADQSYSAPTPIQSQAIPVVLPPAGAASRRRPQSQARRRHTP